MNLDQPLPWDLDPSVYLKSRHHLLAKVARDHARWEHQLAASGEEGFALPPWTDEDGHAHTVVLTTSFLDTHRAVLTSLLQDMELLGSDNRAVAGRIIAKALMDVDPRQDQGQSPELADQA